MISMIAGTGHSEIFGRLMEQDIALGIATEQADIIVPLWLTAYPCGSRKPKIFNAIHVDT